MIPIENSIAGRVADIHNLLPASNLHIIGETFLPIRFQLLALPGVSISDLRSVHSHVHALGQCRKIIRELGLKPVDRRRHGGLRARSLRRRAIATRASLATSLAGEIYGLKTLRENVEDEAHNTTRFVVLSKTPKWASAGNGPVATTFVFRVRNVPAALYKALGGFATNGVNMTKLESYMVDGEFTATQFLADVDGHPHDPAARARAGGAWLLLARAADPGRLSRPPLPPARPLRGLSNADPGGLSCLRRRGPSDLRPRRKAARA